MSERFPALFVSHGAPTLAIDDVPARDFLLGLGKALGRPSAVLAISAHWESADPAVSAAQRPETIHDFHGFPAELYRMRYPAPGAPQLAAKVDGLLRARGVAVHVHANRGLDHGAWVPLLLMYPDADIPVTQLSVQPPRDTRHHFALGETLRPLRDEGVLILASGSATHNLYEFRSHRPGEPSPAWVTGFQEWLAATVEAGDTENFLRYREVAPDAARNHPSEEHFLPIYVAAGAGTPGTAGHRIHRSQTFGVIAMDAYRFD
ncbi:MAG TPA: class III extradiol ring-cleavage dioxygenase [Burkholderiales bacterium]|nr:class III extradiol ring-cleavage dioxygenase [Burkholderiales bacterium]